MLLILGYQDGLIKYSIILNGRIRIDKTENIHYSSSMPYKSVSIQYSEKFRIYSYEVDMTNRVSLQAIVQYLQEVASNHAEKLGFGVSWLRNNQRTWMLSRLKVAMYRYPRVGDDVIIRTWPSGKEKFFLLRDFSIETTDGEVLGVAGSSWVYMNLENHRPVHSSSEELNFFVPDGTARTFSDNPAKIKPSESPLEKGSFSVRYTDLDMNNHVNNIKYLEWLLEGMDPEFRKTHVPVEMEINYLAEALYGHKVFVSLENRDNGYVHTIRNSSKEICRAESRWRSLE